MIHTTIYMIRHAKSPYILNAEKTRGLSAEGQADALLVAEVMKDKDIDLMISSTSARAYETIEMLADIKKLPIMMYEELVERNLKEDSPLSQEEILKAIEASFHDLDFHLENGESIRDVQNRALPVIKKLLREYEGKSIVIGTHGNLMTIVLNYFDSQYGYTFWLSTSKPDIYQLIFSGESLLSVNRLWTPLV